MTIWYPDVSNHEGAMPLQAGTVAVCAKASEGTGYTDPFYGHYRSEAQRVGAVFFAYHFLHAGSGAAQAEHCFAVTGPGVNVMIDHEPTNGSNPTVQDAVDFAVRYRQLGGLCSVDYLPHWYWSNPVGSPSGGMGSPSLAPLAAAGLSLISSSYTTYSDTGPGWAGYGGLSPVIWQYTNALPYSGQSVDFNAFRGTVDQLRALLGYTAPHSAHTPQEGTMLILREQGADSVYGLDGGVLWGISDPPTLQSYINAGIPQATVSPTEIARIQAAQATPATVSVNVDATQLVAALSDAGLLAKVGTAIAHAEAVELHNDTPAS